MDLIMILVKREADGKLDNGNVTGNRIDNIGGNITYIDGKFGQAAVFDGSSGIRLPNGLISSHKYSVLPLTGP